MIRFEEATKVYPDASGGEVTALDRLTLHVAEGETLALIGTSGSGKTTALRMVNRLVEPTSGAVLVNGAEVGAFDPIRLRRSIGYVIQSGGLFPHMTVERNCGILCRLEGWPRKRTRTRVRDLLALVNLDPDAFANRLPGELSGGQRQRVGVARALALDPPVLLMDEPFGALDPITKAQLHDEFLVLKQEVKKTAILVTHDLGEAFRLTDRVGLLHAGRLVQTGTEEDFRSRPADRFVADFVARHFEDSNAAS